MKKKQTPPPPDKAAPERILWLLAFLQRDLTALRQGERLDLLDDCVRLLQMRDPAVVVLPPNGYAIAIAKLKGAPDIPWPDALVLDVQTKLNAGVTRLEAGKSWQPFDDALNPTFKANADKTISRLYAGDYASVMLRSAVDLLVHWWPQLRRCAYPPCNRLFLPEEGRQIYHDKKCSALARWHRLPPRNHQKEKEHRILRNGPGRGSRGRKKR